MERPILMSAEMVRAVIDGRKTQTRRIVKLIRHPSWSGGFYVKRPNSGCMVGIQTLVEGGFKDAGYFSPFGCPGDRLWVRETWTEALFSAFDAPPKHPKPGRQFVGALYKADNPATHRVSKWKPSIHMPRWASRITLEITEVRVERLWDISEEDAKSEGVMPCLNEIGEPRICGHYLAFYDLWNSIYGQRGWDKNEWVWVVSFKVVQN